MSGRAGGAWRGGNMAALHDRHSASAAHFLLRIPYFALRTPSGSPPMLVRLEPAAPLASPDLLPDAQRVAGAVAWGLRAVFGEAVSDDFFTAAAAGDPPVLFSSGFPWLSTGTGRLHLLPRPRLAGADTRADWVAAQVFAALTGQPDLTGIGTGLAGSDPDGSGAQPGRTATGHDEPAAPGRSVRAGDIERMMPRRVRHVRAGSQQVGAAARTFAVGETVFPRGSGWYFLAHVRRTEWLPRLQAAIRWVCDTGWGAERSAGRGVAVPFFETNPLPADETTRGGSFVTLAPWHPSPDERRHVAAALAVPHAPAPAAPAAPSTADAPTARPVVAADYALRRRQGWTGPSRLVVGEGSVVPRPDTPVPGVLAEDGTDAAGTSRKFWGFAYPVAVRPQA